MLQTSISSHLENYTSKIMNEVNRKKQVEYYDDQGHTYYMCIVTVYKFIR